MTEDEKKDFLKDLLLSGCNVNQINFGDGYQQINYGDGQQKRHRYTMDAEDADYEEVASENGHGNRGEKGDDEFASRMRKATDVMWEEKVLKHRHDYAFIKMYMDASAGFPKYKSTQDFINFLNEAGCKDVPSKSTFDFYVGKNDFVDGKIKVKGDKAEEDRRNGIVTRFKELMK